MEMNGDVSGANHVAVIDSWASVTTPVLSTLPRGGWPSETRQTRAAALRREYYQFHENLIGDREIVLCYDILVKI